ncbi:Zinc finger and BTB domain-containing protein 24 [Leucoagaricus sp. SymC.cos]|nr:Zinc finger and BTB domain-containing protein 24 [Leucoagaricus sp. SymC.cos]
MPLCPTCDNRPFATKEALLQHVRTSSNPHPFCLACDRRFSSELAYNAHMAAKHPPTFDCLKCEKQYSSQFALEGHYRGHTDHPNCPVCGKGFYDNASLTTHVRETHNDLWCNTCNLRFETATAANEHYMTSPAHPKCRFCGARFRDEDMLEKVCVFRSVATRHSLRLKHARLHEVNIANGRSTSPSASASGESGTPTLRSPAYTSPTSLFQSPPTSAVSSTVFSPPNSTSTLPKEFPSVQPSTPQGFVSSPPQAFAGVSAQPVPRNGTAISFGGTGFSPLSPKPNIFNKDLRRVAAIDTTMRVDSPDISHMVNIQGSPLLNVQAPMFSPIGLPRPGKQIDELWSSRENVQVPRSRLPRQAGLQPPLGSAIQPPTWNNPPINAAPPISVPSQQLVPYSQPYRPPIIPPRHRPSSEQGDVPTPTANNVNLPSEPPNGSEPRNNSTRAEYNFNPRLYPGSARFAASQTNLTATNTQVAPNRRGSTSAAAIASAHPPLFNSLHPTFDSGVRQQPPSLLSLSLPFSPPERQNSAVRISPPRITAGEEHKGEVRNENGQIHAEREEKDVRQRISIQDDLSLLSAVSTPRFTPDAPLQDFEVKPETDSGLNVDISLPSPSDFSTDFSTISSVSSGMVYAASPTPVNQGRRGTSRSRSRATSSVRQRPSPTSPEVASPAGLAALPAISPVGPSPIDFDTSFDIPEAQHPLPESRSPSPTTSQDILIEEAILNQQSIARDGSPNQSSNAPDAHQEKTKLMNEDESHTLLENPQEPTPLSSPQSLAVSNQEPQELVPSLNEAAPERLGSPSLHGLSHEDRNSGTNHEAELDARGKSPSPTPSPVLATPKAEDEMALPEMASPSHIDSGFNKQQHIVAPSLGETSNISIASTSASDGTGTMGTPSLPSLHCRACRRDTPDDITATMCGHVFCNRCIVDAVIKTSRCPFCSTPTLLYCLFRLDLAT